MPPSVADSALRVLTIYSWPGNVRELENAIERAVTLNQTGTITKDDLPAKIFAAQDTYRSQTNRDDLAPLFEGLPSIDEMERRYFLHVLESTGNNRTRAAEILGINRKTLYRMATRLGVKL